MSKRARKHRHVTQSTPPQGLTLATAALLGLLVTPGVALANKGEPDNADVRGSAIDIFRGSGDDYAVVVETMLDEPRTIIGRYEGVGSSAVAKGGSATIGSADGAAPDIRGKDIYGGYQGKDQAAQGNGVTIYGGTSIKDVYGGYARGGNVSGNTVDMRGGTVDGDVYGGQVNDTVADVYAATNTVTIRGGTVRGSVYGGHNGFTGASTNLAASGNAVVAKGTSSSPVTIEGNVYGNYAGNGLLHGAGTDTNVQLGQDVTVQGGVYGGWLGNGASAASGHTVSIDGATVEADMYGAYHGGSGEVSGNRLTVTSGEVQGDVYGGYSLNGEAKANTVTVGARGATSGPTLDGEIYGGQSGSSTAVDNRVVIHAGAINGDVYGGRGGAADVSGNTVEIAGGTFGNVNVYAGYNYDTGTIANNTISITGGADLEYATLWGRDAENGAVSGNNTLRVAVTDTTVKELKNFAKYTFELPADVQADATLLTVKTALNTTEDSDGNALNPVFTLDTAGPLKTLQLDEKLNLLVVDAGGADQLTLPGGYDTGVRAPVDLKSKNGATIYEGLEKYAFALKKSDGNTLQATLDTVNLYGYEDTGTATGDPWTKQTLTINSPQEAEAINAYGGRAVVAGGTPLNVSRNAVVVDKAKFPSGMAGFKLRESLYGGSIDEGNAVNNTVELRTGTVMGSVFGNHTEDGNASGPEHNPDVTIGGDAQVQGNVYGGYVGTGGTATFNNVSVAGEAVIGGNPGEGNVYGGWYDDVDKSPDTEAVSNNSVAITGGTVKRSAPAAFDEGNVFGGRAESGKASGNTVTVDGKDAVVQGDVYANYAVAGVVTGKNSLDAPDVVINAGTIKGDVIGGGRGASGTSAVTNHVVRITGGTLEGKVYGGLAENGSADSNTVVISGGKLDGDIYGGYALNGTADSNTVVLAGDADMDHSTLYGGWGGSGVSNNTLRVATTGEEAKAAKNFDKYEFVLPDDFKAGAGPMLTLADAMTLSANDVAVDGSGAFVDLGDKGTLLQVTGGLTVNNLPAAPVEAKYRDPVTRAETNLVGTVYELEHDGTEKLDLTLLRKYAYGDPNPEHDQNTPGERNKGNTLTLTEGQYTAAFGGRASDGSGLDVSGNRATMSGGELVDDGEPLSGNLYGGYAPDGNVRQNTARLEGNEGGTDPIVQGSLYGASSGEAAGDVILQNNSAEFAGGTLGGDIYGAAAATTTGKVTATDNTVILSGGDGSTATARGFYAPNATATERSGNTLVVADKNAELKAIENFDTLRFDVLNDIVGGGDDHAPLEIVGANPTDLDNVGVTSVQVNVDPATAAIGDKYNLMYNIEGISDAGGTATGPKTTTLRDGNRDTRLPLYTLEVSLADADGAGKEQYLQAEFTERYLYGKPDGTGPANVQRESGNLLEMSAADGKVTAAFGGRATDDGLDVTNNRVIFTGGEFVDEDAGNPLAGHLYGGHAKDGNATGNAVTLAGGTVAPAAVYANFAEDTSKATTNGIVNLSADAAALDMSATTLWGGNSTLAGGNDGNTLVVEAKGVEAKAAKNFEKYTFALPGDFKADETMLALLEQGDDLDIDGSKVSVATNGTLKLNLGEKATLLSMDKGRTLTVNNLPAEAQSAKLDGVDSGLTTLVYKYDAPAGENTLNITAEQKYLYGDGGANTPGQRNSGNRLNVTGGTATAAFGGRATSGDVTNNAATMSGGTLVAVDGNPLSGNLYGGYADAGNATGNAATLSGGTVENVYGAWAEGNTTGNTAAVTGGTVNRNVYGGHAKTGNATGNGVQLSGGTVGGNVYGGHARTGNATDNTVDYSGGTVRGTLYGGYSANGGDAVSGNTLLVRKSGLQAGNTANFERYWFVLPSDTVANATMLTLNGGKPTDLTNGGKTAPKVGVALLKGAGDPALRPGDRVTLVHNAAGVNSDGFVDDSTALKQHVQGTFVDYDFELAADSNNLYASVAGAAANANAKGPVEGRMGVTALVNMGGDLIAGRGMQAARTATRRKERAENPETYGLTGFATVEGNSSRYETGSHIDVSGVNTLLGLAKRFHSGDVDVLLGAFFEYGTGYVHTHNAGGIDGQGNNSYAGGGLLGRVEVNDAAGGTTYGEASLRMGGARGSWDSKDILPGRSANYDLNTPYYGAHVGLGYVWSPSERMSVETYGKYHWTHVDGDNVSIAGTRFKFKDVESHRVRAGVKADFKVNEQFGFYVGAAWEHEFNGKGEAVVSHLFDAPSPSLQGDIGVFDLGLNFTPAENLFISLGATGYVGKRQGVGGNLMFRYEF